MFSYSKRPDSLRSSRTEKRTDSDYSVEDPLPKYPAYVSAAKMSPFNSRITFAVLRQCPHQNTLPTPILDAHLRQVNTRARLEKIRDALTSIIDAEDDACIKCATTQVASALFLYLKDLREAKQNGEFSKSEKKAWKQEIKGLAKDLKGEIGPEMKRSWKEVK